MAVLARPLLWFYHEFGIDSIQKTGRNAWLMIAARSLRMFAYGTNALVLALFFSELGFSDARIGLFMTLTLLGDVFLGTSLTLIADRFGRRKILLGGSFLMVLTGLCFAIFENFWILLFAAIVGVVSATGGDFGPFRSIEESIISQLTTPSTRSDVLAWYVTFSAWGSSVGSEASGRIIDYLQNRDGWTIKDAYHSLFWVYAVMGIVNAMIVFCLSKDCEADALQDEKNPAEPSANPTAPVEPSSQFKALTTRLTSWTGHISGSTLSVVWKLWALLALDSLADGMVPYSLTTYYMDTKFHPKKSTLGDAISVSYFLQAIGGVFAGPLARKIGLVNTMVFTHIPSSAAVLLFPWPNVFWMTVILLCVRSGLNNMDQAPRTALIAAIVKPEERTAVMGITSMLRTLAATTGPMVTGFLAGSDRFWVAFVAGGAFRLSYDVGLWVLFVHIELHQHEKPADDDLQMAEQFRLSDREDEESTLSEDARLSKDSE
ncbi:uncharacterized protein MYCFIDRAFT_157723 [Pseudocercospora fijiensis CIRAD86]|uniref:Major facilitator superfamily (MFS) profile domain-containing protein n=1 Tax=Pseudocercospora fijiensis (strain CIRAD86) TaxID=383855 RepID=M2ZZS0_PSEFD|nr:uncharacterized protein MYCFIDRAFT_157723 [Pseudocercospora fijiensis CIRAD86]EME77656.1 hypothetical protein MYCFIDRAFT_157723 [Pseudocercospora fijiensis CIRAD86]